MALTNYLMQTVIGICLFYGIGLGLMGEVGPVTWPLIAVTVVAPGAAAGGGSAGSRSAHGMAVAAGHVWPFFSGFKFRRLPADCRCMPRDSPRPGERAGVVMAQLLCSLLGKRSLE